MLFEWILFAILGVCEFAMPPNPPPTAGWRFILAIVFVVLMVVWLAFGIYPMAAGGDWGHLFHR